MKGRAPAFAFKKEPKANLEIAYWFLLELKAPKCCSGAEYSLPFKHTLHIERKRFHHLPDSWMKVCRKALFKQELDM